MEQMFPTGLHHRTHKNNPYQRNWYKHLPPQAHDLIVAIARKRCPKPQKEENQKAHFGQKPKNAVG